MARIDFHSNIADKVTYSCRLIRKIMGSPVADLPMRNIVVVGDEAFLKQLDAQLWTFSPTEFLPHTWSRDDSAIETPIVFAQDFDDQYLEHLPHGDVLIHAGTQAPNLIENLATRFPRIVELVSTQEQDRLAGRERYKQYRDLGHELHNFDQSAAK